MQKKKNLQPMMGSTVYHASHNSPHSILESSALISGKRKSNPYSIVQLHAEASVVANTTVQMEQSMTGWMLRRRDVIIREWNVMETSSLNFFFKILIYDSMSVAICRVVLSLFG